MSIRFLRRTGFIFVLGIVLGHALIAKGQGDGIFAEFYTSMGSFTCRLEYAASPKAAANFIGLATGQRSWLDINTGAVRNEPFYDGITFHRIVSGFVIQSGSRNGTGSDSPGYVFTDEFTNSLRYSGAGVLGMANSGTNSNGAQFFITLAAEPTLNDHYSIFGEVTGGTNVVQDIGRVGSDFFSGKPTNEIVLRNVIIRRVGAEADAFDINAQGLPVVTSVPLEIAKGSSNVFSLTFSNRAPAENFLFSTTNLYVPGLYTNVYATTNYFSTNVVIGHTNETETNATTTNIVLNTTYETNTYTTNLAVWDSESLGIEVPGSPMTNMFYRTRTNDSGYFRLAQVIYTGIYVPKELKNRTLTLNFDDDALVPIVIKFDGSDGGTYTTAGEPPDRPLDSYTWSQSYFQGSLDPIDYSGFTLPMSLTLIFNGLSNGVFSGTVNSQASYPVTGNFTLSPVH
jgi:peptidyl-prolyl cis-trans isomerase A (cyclophilin A)